MIRTIWALLRVDALQAATYRLRLALSVGGMLVAVVPLYYIAGALQTTVADAIRGEGHQYFGFVLIGSVVVSLVGVSTNALPQAIGSGVSTGFLESLFTTRSRRSAILVGLTSYAILWTLLRGALVLGFGAAMGAAFHWTALGPALVIILLIITVHWAIGLLGGAMVLLYRTAGPLSSAVVLSTTLIAGVYFPTRSLPAWLQWAPPFVPATYGLRALRRVFIEGSPLADVLPDVMILVGLAIVLLTMGVAVFRLALGHALRTGSLSQY